MNDLSSLYTEPFNRRLTTAWALSILAGALMAVMSLAGLVFPQALYPTQDLIQAFRLNDAVNLVVGLPLLVGAMGLHRRGELAGLLLWPGALLYTLYNYLVYLIGMPFGWPTASALALVLVSAYAIFSLVQITAAEPLRERLVGTVGEKLAGWVLVIFGSAFLLRALGILVGAGVGQAPLPLTEIGLLIADISLSILLIAGGASLLRRLPLGYASGAGLLYSASALFLGLIMVLLLQPVFEERPLATVDVLVVAVLGLVCFVPFGLFLQGVLSSSPPSTGPTTGVHVD